MNLFGKKKSAGFTLIEILISISLIVLIGGSVFTLFLRGTQLYGRLDRMVSREETSFFLEKLTRDLRSGFKYSLVPWTVEKDSLSFPSNVLKEGADAVVRVSYRYDDNKKQVLREESPFPFETGSGWRVVAENVQGIVFEATTENEEETPTKITLRLDQGGSRPLEKKILIPVGRVELTL